MTYEQFIEEWKDGSDTVRCFSSGSTGTPKEIFLPKKEMLKSARRTMNFFGLGSHSHLHSCISPDFIGGKMMAVRASLHECTFTWELPTNRPLTGYEGNDIDLLSVVPSQLDYLVKHAVSLPVIKHILVGGAPVNPQLRNAVIESGLEVWESYGMTETASHIALRKIDRTSHGFTPLPGITVTQGQDLRLGINIAGWQDIVTNDLMEILPDGTFIITGRSDNVIISGGMKIHPEQIEERLEEKFGKEMLLTSTPDMKWGERTVLMVEDLTDELTPDAIGIDSDINANKKLEYDNEILCFCRETFRPEFVPKEITHVKLPRTSNGKKNRKEARELAAKAKFGSKMTKIN